MDLENAGRPAKFLIRDRDGKFPLLFDTILADAGIQVVLSGILMLTMNSIVERDRLGVRSGRTRHEYGC